MNRNFPQKQINKNGNTSLDASRRNERTQESTYLGTVRMEDRPAQFGKKDGAISSEVSQNKQENNKISPNRAQGRLVRSASAVPSDRKSQTNREVRDESQKREITGTSDNHLPSDKDLIRDNDIVRIKGDMDRTFLILVIVLICFGSVMVFSASYAYALASRDNSYYFIERQIAFVALGLGAMLFVANFIDYRLVKKFTGLYFFVVCVLLVLVLVMGSSEGEAQRWLIIPGTGIGVQPSELMKLGIVLVLAKYFSDNEEYLFRKKFFLEPVIRRLFIPFIVVLFICGLIALEKHFSGVIILFLIGAVVIFAAGGQLRWIIGAAAAFVVGIVSIIMTVPYARSRIDVWLHPENYSSQSETWQTIQGLNAVGSGGFFGVGLGQSIQKHMFVSQPQNDFIFAIICEELGFVGAVATIVLFVSFVWRGTVIAQNAPDSFSKLVVIGIIAKVAIQAVLNMAVVTNTIPNTGISLPFFSYGGSSLVMLLFEMGIILSISRYSYQKK